MCLLNDNMPQIERGAFEQPNVRPVLHVHDAAQPLFSYQAYQSA